MLVYLLGQSRAFEVYHYVYSWLNINETGAVAVTTSGDVRFCSMFPFEV